MKQLTYLVHWGKNKETAWSGTNYSLYKALSKHFQINDKDLKFPKVISVFMHRILRLDWFSSGFYELLYFRHKYKGTQGKVLQMSSIVDGGNGTQSYIYNDLSVSYVEYMKEHLPDVYDVSGFQDANASLIHKHAMVQSKFYDTCSAIFCMGHWLREYLVSTGISEHKAVFVGGYKYRPRLN